MVVDGKAAKNRMACGGYAFILVTECMQEIRLQYL
jgi:hypothetical protein